MKITAPEKLIAPIVIAVLVAALVLGALAFTLSRHEEAFRREELRNLLRSECRLFAERCGQELDVIRAELELKAASTMPDAESIRLAVAEEPFFTAGFLADRSGTLLHAGNGETWRRRYDELFTELVSAKAAAAPVPSVQNMLQETASPSQSEKLVEPVPKREQFQRITMNYNRDNFQLPSVRNESAFRSAELDCAPEIAASEPAGAIAEPGLLPRFATLTRGRSSGFIPYFAANRFVPLVWAESIHDPGRIVGFELESSLLWSRLIPANSFEVKTMLRPIFLKGKLVYDLPSLSDIIAYADEQMDSLWPEYQRLVNPEEMWVQRSAKVSALREKVLKEESLHFF